MVSFKDFINQPRTGHKFITHCYPEIYRKDLFAELQQLNDDEPVTILIGPEGDFSLDEVLQAEEKGYQSVTLGKSRLRTETAGMMAVCMAQLSLHK